MADKLVQDMLDLAKRLAHEATAIAQARFGRIHPSQVTRKPDDSVVTETDHAIQAHLLKAVGEAYPEHAICAEEAFEPTDVSADPATARYCWVMDPLDGTRNYTSGFPCFATSIAVLDQGRPVVAVVLEHNLQLLYAAAAGQGATLNGRPIHTVEAPVDGDMLVGIPSTKDRLTVSVLRSWTATPGLICRNTGSTAFHLGMVASGALAAAFCRRAKIWDVAAGVLLVTEAGGRATDPFGDECVPFKLDADPDADVPSLAAAPRTHERLLESIRAAVQ
jgi:myo-inositol-1(or 4)-monophosphatase